MFSVSLVQVEVLDSWILKSEQYQALRDSTCDLGTKWDRYGENGSHVRSRTMHLHARVQDGHEDFGITFQQNVISRFCARFTHRSLCSFFFQLSGCAQPRHHV
jgi:hypothetical protein